MAGSAAPVVPNTPAVVAPAVAEQQRYVANTRYQEMYPGGQLREGNLPRSASQAVHAVDDVVLRATGPGSDRFRGFIDNTTVFRGMAEALGLGR